jgi:large conductance mechanosensitive channel
LRDLAIESESPASIMRQPQIQLPEPPMEITAIVQEFKTFILKGNVVDLAVAVVIGQAFTKIVEAFTLGVVLPFINLFGGNSQISLHFLIFDLGLVISAVLSFLISAAVVFFFVVKPIGLLTAIARRQAEEKPSEPAPIPEDVKLLMEIRDLLKARAV